MLATFYFYFFLHSKENTVEMELHLIANGYEIRQEMRRKNKLFEKI